jgi:stage V sporulation protein SpoVS
MGNDNGELLLKVAATTPVAQLSGAISGGVFDGKSVTLRAIGHGAIGQAVKGVAAARGHTAQQGIDLAVVPGFQTIDMPESANRRSGPTTAITLRVIKLGHSDA